MFSNKITHFLHESSLQGRYYTDRFAMTNHYKGEVNLKLLRHGNGQYNYPNAAFRLAVIAVWKIGSYQCGATASS